MDHDSLVKERKRSSGGKNKHRRKKKNSNYDSSSDEGTEKVKISSRRRKKWYSSEEYSSSSLSSYKSSTDEESHRSKKSLKRRKKHYSTDSSSTSESEDKRRKGVRKRERVRNKEKKGKDVTAREDLSDDNRGSVPKDDKELVRREIGLEWMLKPLNNPARIPAKPNASQEESQVEEVIKSNPKELNPYLKADGSGYPEDLNQTKVGGNQLLPSSVVGDGGASWRRKALKRAQEQAAREGRKLQEVVEERWDSVGHLAVSAASRAAPAHAHLHAIKDRKRGVTGKQETVSDDKSDQNNEKIHGGRREHSRDVSLRRPEMREPKVHDSLSWRKRKDQNLSAEDAVLISAAASSLNKFENDGSFMREVTRHASNDVDGSSHKNLEGTEQHMELDMVSSSTNKHGEESSVVKQSLSANQLAAKAMQLRMKGKHEEAEKLLKEAEMIRMKQDSGPKLASQGTEKRTSTYIMKDASIRQKKKEDDDADMHLAQKIVQNKRYSISGRADDEYDFDDGPSRKQNRRRGGVPQQTENSNIMKRVLTQQERCQFCFENPTRPRHLVVSLANFTYLMLPQGQPVVQGHCYILPMQHESATRTIDNDAWEEIRNFKKCLIMMFAKQDKEVVFLETVMGLAQQRRHCLVECIPLPQDISRQAPLYFKKAIDEAEEEWSQHNAKKLIDTSEKGLRGSIPKNFPYFHVEFGLNKGFVHVIDDEKQFKSNLGLNVIRGMLRLPEEDMYRRQKHESVETQKQAVASFAREWAPFDWTKQLGQGVIN